MKMRFLAVLALLALPAQAEECFTGKARQVTYDDGRVITIIQRHGDDLTYTIPYEGFQDSVHKTHLMLFPKQSRAGARMSETRWTTRLPRLKDMVPGYAFDMKGTMKSGEGKELPYRITGEVTGQEPVMVGTCSYDTVVIKADTFVDGQIAISATSYFSPDLMLVLRDEAALMAAGTMTKRQVVALQ